MSTVTSIEHSAIDCTAFGNRRTRVGRWLGGASSMPSGSGAHNTLTRQRSSRDAFGQAAETLRSGTTVMSPRAQPTGEESSGYCLMGSPRDRRPSPAAMQSLSPALGLHQDVGPLALGSVVSDDPMVLCFGAECGGSSWWPARGCRDRLEAS